jgi:AraC-like DNA-binding protein
MPHQYDVWARLHEAATTLAVELVKVLDIALDYSFGDVSNLNRAFRTEFGVSPRVYDAKADARGLARSGSKWP